MHWINIKSITAIAAAAVAAGTGTHLVQQREANRLRGENQDLIAQQEKLTSERDRILSATTAKNEEFERLQKDKNELLRLRSEVGMLRKQANRPLQASPAKADQRSATPELNSEAVPKVVVDGARRAQLLASPLVRYAAENEGRFPTNFDEAAPYFREADLTDPSLRGEAEFTEVAKQFEIVFQGSRDTLTNARSTILFRERIARQRPDGKWEKEYGFADGHAEIWLAPDEDFESREILRPTMSAPTNSSGFREHAIIFRK